MLENVMNKHPRINNMKGKPFMVRLPNPAIRDAYERYCADHLRSLDAQSSVLIMRELKIQGYLDDLSDIDQKLQQRKV
jgi:hypothetical protein